MKRNLKARLRACELTIGSWITLGHAAIGEIMGRAGFDWITIDLEHSTIDLEGMQHLIRTIDLLGCVPLVRLSSNDPIQIKRVLDAGAGGIIVPNVKTAAEAEAIVQAVYYPPIGSRGVGLARAQGYGASFEAYKKTLLESLIIVVQIEHVDAVNNLESILSIPEIDAFMVGPYDLSGSIGEPGNFETPLFKELIEATSQAAQKLKKCSGIHVVEPDQKKMQRAVADGYRMIAYSVDIRMLDVICREGIRSITRMESYPVQLKDSGSSLTT